MPVYEEQRQQIEENGRNGQLESRHLPDAFVQILEIELQEQIPPHQKTLLWRFLEDHFRSSDETTLAVVCSAIRTWVRSAEINELDQLAHWIQIDNGPVRFDVQLEIEIAKMVARKLASHKEWLGCVELPLLRACFENIVTAYLHPRIRQRRRFGAALVQAAVALIVLDGNCPKAIRTSENSITQRSIQIELSELAQLFSSTDPRIGDWLLSPERWT